ncbi:hypothetical protein CPC08DRAFT_171083 [Agrocybe pediades]|nr:hypothetical protein CPC08DRAFT_171083 [Agrocybe pediades]
MTALNGWHRGEILARQKTGYDKAPETAMLWTSIQGEMSEQHSTFHTTRLHFLPVCVLDEERRPWGSVLVGKDGNPGYIHHPKYDTLLVQARLWEKDPFNRVLDMWKAEEGTDLLAGIGVELSTRRRNKFAGKIVRAERKDEDGNVDIEMVVNQALGNCPKYITLRELVPYSSASPVVVNDEQHLPGGERLSGEAISLILESDTVFLGSTYAASKEEASRFPSHLGMNHRGGRPGFIRVKPSDGRTIVLPDLSGNRYMTTLGNIEATPLAALTFISFTTGDILYVTGKARNVYGLEAHKIMPLQDTLTEIYVTGYTYIRDALPLRVKPGYEIDPSPYSPPIKLLAEEAHLSKLFSHEEQPTALLTRMTLHSPTIATFEWESSVPLKINPGQAIILDFKPFLGSRRYQHMSPMKPTLVNDDFIRTWTVSNYLPHDSTSRSFSLTMREKTGGTVTGALFTIARKLSQLKPSALEDSRGLSLTAKVVGVNGDFVLPSLPAEAAVEGLPEVEDEGIKRLFWFAGGIGVTPFISMLAALSRQTKEATPPWEITLFLSTREPDIFLSLIFAALKSIQLPQYLSVHLFADADTTYDPNEYNFVRHSGRISKSFLEDKKDVLVSNESVIFLCGSDSYERNVVRYLTELSVDAGRIKREGFAY